jgi:hypothetical protein
VIPIVTPFVKDRPRRLRKLGLLNDSFALLWLVWVAPSRSALIPCQCFMETCTGDLAKAYTNKAYQEKEERYNMNNENQRIL